MNASVCPSIKRRLLVLLFICCLGIPSADALLMPQKLIPLLQSMALGRGYEHYRIETLRKLDRSYSTPFSLLPQVVYRGEQEEGRVYLLHNESPETLRLDGYSLLCPGDLAISLTKTTLLPQEQALLLVVSKIASPSYPQKPTSLASHNHLASGTFVKAILLGGVDAATTGAALSEPRPVLLRIIGSGTLPNQQEANLKGCHVLASVQGDLSSERVYMQLEKLTCMDSTTGKVKERRVEGYVVGEDGKTGVRGVVVDKAGPLIRHNLLCGFLMFVSKLLEHPQNLLASPFKLKDNKRQIGVQHMLSAGASASASQVFEQYVQFFIRRAEQLQPVLQINAGREVEIVFTKGVRLKKKSLPTISTSKAR